MRGKVSHSIASVQLVDVGSIGEPELGRFGSIERECAPHSLGGGDIDGREGDPMYIVWT